MYSVCNVYTKLDDPVDKFLVAFVYELGYKQTIAARILGVTDAYISMKLKRIRNKLKKKG